MISKKTLGAVIVIILVVAIADYLLMYPRNQPIVNQSALLYLTMSQSRLLGFHAFNGSNITIGADSYSFFLGFNTSTPLRISAQNNTLVPTGNLTTMAQYTQHASHVSSNVAVYPTPIFTTTAQGVANDPGLIEYSGQLVGSGDNVEEIFVTNNDWTTYTNGTHYRVENGTYFAYLFAFGNESEMPFIVPIGHSVNNSVVSSSSPIFPKQLLPVLQSLQSSSGISFIPDGKWWYYGYYNVQLVPSSLPGSFRRAS